MLILTLMATGIGGLVWWQLQRRFRCPGVRQPNLFLFVLVVGVLCRLAYVGLTPVFYAPDEQSHFNYVKFLAAHGEFPVQTAKIGDPANEWEYSQPPIYYLALAPFFRFAETIALNETTTVFFLRSFSFLLWLLNVWFGVTLLNRLQINDRIARTFFLSLICLLPTYVFTSSTINNDNLLATLGGGLLSLLSRRDYTLKTSLLVGLLLGLALLTKQSAVVFIPVLGILASLECFHQRISGRSALLYLSVALGSAFLIYLPWAIRNWQVYHTFTPEFLSVTMLQWPSPLHGIASAAHNLVKTFWAVSGIANNIGYPFPLLGMVFLICCLGSMLFGFYRHRRFSFLHSSTNQTLLVACYLGVIVNLFLAFRVGYQFGMGQGRHLFPLLFPIALFLGSWLRLSPVKKIEVHTAGCWILYALAFTAYSLARFPR